MYLKSDYTIMARRTFEKVLKVEEKITLGIQRKTIDNTKGIYGVFEQFGRTPIRHVPISVKLESFDFFEAVKNFYFSNYLSLRNLELDDFSIDRSKVSWYTIESKQQRTNFRFKSARAENRVQAEVLKIFEFYINCEICFKQLSLRHQKARLINRGDIMSTCEYDLSNLTLVNSFEGL